MMSAAGNADLSEVIQGTSVSQLTSIQASVNTPLLSGHETSLQQAVLLVPTSTDARAIDGFYDIWQPS